MAAGSLQATLRNETAHSSGVVFRFEHPARDGRRGVDARVPGKLPEQVHEEDPQGGGGAERAAPRDCEALAGRRVLATFQKLADRGHRQPRIGRQDEPPQRLEIFWIVLAGPELREQLADAREHRGGRGGFSRHGSGLGEGGAGQGSPAPGSGSQPRRAPAAKRPLGSWRAKACQ